MACGCSRSNRWVEIFILLESVFEIFVWYFIMGAAKNNGIFFLFATRLSISYMGMDLAFSRLLELSGQFLVISICSNNQG